MLMRISIFLLSIFNLLLIAQEPDPASFFPHHLGDVWEYGTSFGIYRYEITKDSVLEDSNGYYIYYNNHSYPKYWIDSSLNVLEYPLSEDKEWIEYKLNADSGFSWIVYNEDSDSLANYRIKALVKDVYPIYVFGIPSIAKKIDYFEQIVDDTTVSEYLYIYTKILASGFGFIWEVGEGDQWPEPVLNGCIIQGDTFGVITSIKNEGPERTLPKTASIKQNYPNPFNSSTLIKYYLPRSTAVKLEVFDLRGAKIATLLNTFQNAGVHKVTFNASNLPSSVYIYRLKTSISTLSKRMLLIK